jgi:hypothetical protein
MPGQRYCCVQCVRGPCRTETYPGMDEVEIPHLCPFDIPGVNWEKVPA